MNNAACMAFDHRVLRPWARDPAFYRVVWGEQSDTPAHEGPAQVGAIELWHYPPPLSPARLAELRRGLQAIPPLVEQARGNLVEDVRDHWLTGIYLKREESQTLAAFGTQAAAHHPELLPDVERARQAVDAFRAWLEAGLPGKTGRAGVRPADYDWYMRHVQLVPFSWRDEVVLMERELGRSRGHLLPSCATATGTCRSSCRRPTRPSTPARSEAAVVEVVRFLRDGKQMANVITTGGSASAYGPEGLNRFTVRELLAPIEQTARLCGIEYLPPYLVQGTHRMTDADLDAVATRYAATLTALNDGRVDIDAWRSASSLDALVGTEAPA